MKDFVSMKSIGFNYLINPDGIILSQYGKPMKYYLDKDGYPRLGLKLIIGGSSNQRIHRLVALMFIPNHLNKEFVNHINRNKSDFKVKNLEWCTYEENLKHWKKLEKKNRKIFKLEEIENLIAAKDSNYSASQLLSDLVNRFN